MSGTSSEVSGQWHVLRRSQSFSPSGVDSKPGMCIRYTRSVNLSVEEGQKKREERSKHTIHWLHLSTFSCHSCLQGLYWHQRTSRHTTQHTQNIHMRTHARIYACIHWRDTEAVTAYYKNSVKTHTCLHSKVLYTSIHTPRTRTHTYTHIQTHTQYTNTCTRIYKHTHKHHTHTHTPHT